MVSQKMLKKLFQQPKSWLSQKYQ